MSGFTLHGVQLFPHLTWAGIGSVQNTLGKIAFVLLPGHAALMMFFVISGCVLRVSLQYRPQAWAAGVWRFAIARVFRIFPIVVAGTLLAAWVGVWQTTATAEQLAMPLTISTLVANMLLLDASINGTLWALQTEVLMAPVIALCYFLERSCGTRVLIAAVVVTTTLSFSKTWTFWPPLSHNLFAFLLGMLVPTVGAATRDWVVARDRGRPLGCQCRDADSGWSDRRLLLAIQRSGRDICGSHAHRSHHLSRRSAGSRISGRLAVSSVGAVLR